MYGTEELNETQKLAVLDTEGAVLITAGAGSGKTRLLTHRIAHLIKDLGVQPYNILAITFTNKAAAEMRTRLCSMLEEAEGVWISTFHAACVRILRRFIDKIGFDKNFTIYGDQETKAVIKRVCKECDIHDDMQKRVASEISKAKNKGVSPEAYASVFKFAQDSDSIAAAYKAYRDALRSNNALDYDDLLIYTLALLKDNAEAREFYQNKFRYIHIDEFQDTNVIQYEIVKILAGKHGNIFAVGDEDQCIYTWRGASIANIFDFQRDFKCKMYKLEQNYRSTDNILTVANRIIKGNTQRLDKKLWTENGVGEKVVCFAAATEGYESDFVVRTIYELTHSGDYNYSDCAVLFRLNALTRAFEERFLQYGIPHKVYGGFKFFDRKEVKDVLAYARLAANHYDDEALFRIINFPRRGIGEASIDKIAEYARQTGRSAYDVVVDPASAPFAPALKNKLVDLGMTLKDLGEKANGDAAGFFKHLLFNVLDVVGLFSDDDDGEARLENLNELIASVKDFVKNNPSATVADYLQTVSLYSDTDDMGDDDCVTLATVHSAKGLEFPIVFVVGLEDGIFPSMRQNEQNADHMEEERRLMYVAVTRAKRRLFLTYAKQRYLYGDTHYSIPSRFLSESGLVERKSDARDAYTSSPSQQAVGGMRGFAKSVAKSSDVPRSGYDSGTFSGSYKSNITSSEPKKTGADSAKISVGATVMHKRLGKGKVLGLENLGNNVYARIEFERGGVMVLAVDFAPITVVEE